MTAGHYTNSQNSIISFNYSWFLCKNLSNFVSLPWNSTTGNAIVHTYCSTQTGHKPVHQSRQKALEVVCCKRQQKKFLTSLRSRRHLKDLNDSKLFVYESKWFTWSSRINLIPFKIFRCSLFHKPALELTTVVMYTVKKGKNCLQCQ